MTENNLIPEILTLVDKEKFRRKTIIATKLIAVGLVLAIVWFGYVNYSYAKEVNSYMSKYGSMGHCYMCGLETYKKCECQYNYASYNDKEINFTEVGENAATWNIQLCETKDLAGFTNPLSNLTLKK